MTQLEQIQELNEALITQLNIHKSRWKWMNTELPRLIKQGEVEDGYSGEQLLDFAKQNDFLYYRRD